MSLDLDRLVLGPCAAAFGEVAQGHPVPVYTPAGHGAFSLDGIFDAGYSAIDLLTGPSITTVQPTFGVRLSQVPAGVALAPNDGVVIRGVAYRVREVRPDSHGHARLMLNKAA